METEQTTNQEAFEPTIEDMIQTENGIPTTTSLVIAQVFDKEHKNVLRDIQNLECSPQFRQLNFELYEYGRCHCAVAGILYSKLGRYDGSE